MVDVSELKLKPNGDYADRLHYILNREKYIEYWMSIPVVLPKQSRLQRFLNLFTNKEQSWK